MEKSADAISMSKTSYYSGRKVRASMWHYLLGRGMTAIVSFTVAILLVRILPVETYGAYTALTGLLVTLGIISDGGLDRVIPKFLPTLRTQRAEAQLAGLSWKLLGLRAIFIGVALIPILLFSDSISGFLSLDNHSNVIWPFALYIFLACIAVHLSRTLQALLLQRNATRAMALEWLTKLAALLLILALMGGLSLMQVVRVQTIAVSLAALYMLVILHAHLGLFKSTDTAAKRFDISPARLWRFGWHNYLPNLIGLIVSSNTMKLISAAYLGSIQTAALGFAFAITGMMRNYLPAILMLGLIEPVFMARYAERREFSTLNEMGSIIVKINLFVLAPATVWLALCGAPVIDFITAGKYTNTVWLLTGLMVSLMFYSHGLVLKLILNAVEESWLLLVANLWASLAGMLQIAAMLLYGLPGMLAGILLIAWFENVYIVKRLRAKNHPYHPHWQGIVRIMVLALASGILGASTTLLIPGLIGSLLAGLATVGLFLLFGYLWKPFLPSERALLNRFIGRNWIVW